MHEATTRAGTAARGDASRVPPNAVPALQRPARVAIRLVSFASVFLLAASAIHPTVATNLPSLPPGSDHPPEPTLWGALPPVRQDEIRALVDAELQQRITEFDALWSNTTGLESDQVHALVPGIYNDLALALSRLKDPSQAPNAVLAGAMRLAEELGLHVPDPEETGMACQSNLVIDGGDLGLYDGPAIPVGCIVGLLVLGPVLMVAVIVIVVALIVAVAVAALATATAAAVAATAQAVAAATAAKTMLIAMTVIDLILFQVDHNKDGVGDEFQQRYNITKLDLSEPDPDQDGLGIVQEFRWGLVPICLPAYQNCVDHERDPATGAGGDNWRDGEEVAYWNNPANDALLTASAQGIAITDGDRHLDSDGDASSNVDDTDSDNDGILDGAEILLGTYPEFADSDCQANATACTNSASSSYYDTSRLGQPGTGDGLDDSAERTAWDALGANKRLIDFDGDGNPNNLLDPDADADGLLDGTEFLLGKGQVRADLKDTESDGVPDGSEMAWSEDTDLDGLVNANDPDSDGDGMPDKWELDNHFNMVDPSDALLDRDGDQLNNLGEYRNATAPDDMDSEGDLLLDGEEVNTYGTDPNHWDTDRDAMPDRYEAQNGLKPLESGDAAQDLDLDSFDRNNDGTHELAWLNLDEYRYGRGAAYDESTQGPWLLGTSASTPDTDRDTAKDGYEVYYGTDPRIPAELEADDDQDGLNWTMEVAYGTDPDDPDTDHDGLCDGGRAAACNFPGGASGFQPGEATYNASPLETDSDGDGVSDSIEAQQWDPGASGDASDVDADQHGGLIDSDGDGDGLTDGEERHLQLTDMKASDTDGDGLIDGEEVNWHTTNPLVVDTDGDGLQDGAEVTAIRSSPLLVDSDGDSVADAAEVQAGTSPVLPDSDGDSMPDAWEIASQTNPVVDDADVDLDQDTLVNVRELGLGTHPRSMDSDADGMPDDYEVHAGLLPAVNDAAGDFDFDGLSNSAEHQAGTLPANGDTDADGASDGWETNTARSDPIAPDTDGDGFDDGPEKSAWDVLSATAWSIDHDGDTLNGVRDVDSDNDGLSDRDEFQATMTRPDREDTDGDSVSDFDEVVTWGGQYDPTNPDTDGDGSSDAEEIALLDANADDDQDGLKNGDEDSYGTDRSIPDTDCDGITDGPEYEYWGSATNLLISDVDGDNLLDGIEIGTTGTPPQAFYRTLPDVADSDYDELNDYEEASNGVHVACDPGAGSSSTSASPFAKTLDAPTLALPVPMEGTDSATQLHYGRDANGWYIQGGYGVRLYVDATLPAAPSFQELLDNVGPQAATGPAPGTNGQTTAPGEPDTDFDGLTDGQEVRTYGTDPTNCDTDGDGLGDALEVGLAGRGAAGDPCRQRDRDPVTRTDPRNADTDGDGLQDGKPLGARGSVTWEDANTNGKVDASSLLGDYCPKSGESSPSDEDTDDDGIPDDSELLSGEFGSKTETFCFDTDRDGLSDGLEQGLRNPVPGTRLDHYVMNGAVRTWQPYQGHGSMTDVLDADSDDDGIVDGLEDFNRNGVWGEWSSAIGALELDPDNADRDGDGLTDGLELRIWSKTYEEIAGRAAWSPSQLRFEENPGSPLFNPFESDPRNGDTDDDGTGDGYDINPRLDAVLQLAFERGGSALAFKTHESSDPCCWTGYWKPDLVFFVELQFLGIKTSLRTNTIQDLYSKDWVSTGKLPVGPMHTPGGLDPTDTELRGANNDIPTLTFDLPEDIGDLSTSPSGATVVLTIQGWDNDVGNAAYTKSDDMLDFNPTTDTQDGDWSTRQISKEINLLKDPGSGIKAGQGKPWEGRGTTATLTGDGANDFDGDVKSSLGIRFFDDAPRYFIDNALKVKSLEPVPPPKSGHCYGTASCS